MTKKQSYSSDWKIVLIILGIILTIWIISSIDWDNTNTSTYESYTSETHEETIISDVSNTQTYCYNGECYTTYEEYSSAEKADKENKEFEEINNKWTQHQDIILNDAEKTNEAYNNNCVNINFEDVPNCINIVYPRLESYATHVSNAQSFMINDGEIFNIQQKLLGIIDEHMVYIKTIANMLDTLVNEYNSWVASQQQSQEQAQQNSEMLSNIVKILAMAI